MKKSPNKNCFNIKASETVLLKILLMKFYEKHYCESYSYTLNIILEAFQQENLSFTAEAFSKNVFFCIYK